MTYGTVTNLDGAATVRFERFIDAAIDTVWEALTEPEQLSEWLAKAALDARPGGSVEIDFGEGGRVTGMITVCVPPRTIEYTWTFAGEPDSVVRFELTTDGARTKLILVHRMVPAAQGTGYGAGWHAHLDVLAATIEGGSVVDWGDRFNAVVGHYTP